MAAKELFIFLVIQLLPRRHHRGEKKAWLLLDVILWLYLRVSYFPIGSHSPDALLKSLLEWQSARDRSNQRKNWSRNFRPRLSGNQLGLWGGEHHCGEHAIGQCCLLWREERGERTEERWEGLFKGTSSMMLLTSSTISEGLYWFQEALSAVDHPFNTWTFKGHLRPKQHFLLSSWRFLSISKCGLQPECLYHLNWTAPKTKPIPLWDLR